MTTPEVIGSIAAGLALIIPAIKWLINDWAKKATQVEELKAKNAALQLSRFDEGMKRLSLITDRHEASLRDHGIKIDGLVLEMVTHRNEMKETRRDMSDFMGNINGKIQNMIKTEVVDLTKKLMMIRNKKDGVS